jgi:predicted TIM-barrel fold metal-dependent hydrolase
MPENEFPVVDMHVHVGLVGDRWPQWGRMSAEFRSKTVYKTFLLYARVAEDAVCDELLRQKTLEVVAESSVDYIVGLALDPVYTPDGRRAEARSHLWVDNDYVIDLRSASNGRILLGASVHPYDPSFKERVRKYVDLGAVLLKWLPSAQQIDLEDLRVRSALEFLATAGPGGHPLPVLLHCGPEYAIPSTDTRTSSYDYLHWSSWDSFVNLFRFRNRWQVRHEGRIRENLERGLEAGAAIIFAHCGLPYFFGSTLARIFEHSEADQVADYLQRSIQGAYQGRCYADISALATPFRKSYFGKVRSLPQELLLYGSDFPTPIFELSADAGEMIEDLRAVIDGHLDRIIVPQDNLLDVNLRELRHFFTASPVFTNFARHGFLRI